MASAEIRRLLIAAFTWRGSTEPGPQTPIIKGSRSIQVSNARGVHLISSAGRLREIMLERQKVGNAAAKKRGAYTGRAPTAQAKGVRVLSLHAKATDYALNSSTQNNTGHLG